MLKHGIMYIQFDKIYYEIKLSLEKKKFVLFNKIILVYL